MYQSKHDSFVAISHAHICLASAQNVFTQPNMNHD